MVEVPVERKKKHRIGYPKVRNSVCVRYKGEVKRVTRSEAEKLVSLGATYVAKSVWKREVRDVGKQPEVASESREKETKKNLKGKQGKKQREAAD